MCADVASDKDFLLFETIKINFSQDSTDSCSFVRIWEANQALQLAAFRVTAFDPFHCHLPGLHRSFCGSIC